MHEKINNIIQYFAEEHIPTERRASLNELVQCMQQLLASSAPIRLNFICTHNSRRSHFAQIWAQTMASHFNIQQVYCYSGGTETTALFDKVADTLINQGFEVIQLSEGSNPVYAIKYDANESPIIGFSKEYHHKFNPPTDFLAIMTCSSADQGCPIVFGATNRFSIKYEDPKMYDATEIMNEQYHQKSLEIGQEMWYVFSKINFKK